MKPSIFLRQITLREAVNSPAIHTELKVDKKATIRKAVLIVVEGLKSFGDKNKLTPQNISLWVNDFLEIYYTDSFEDLAMMFKLARQGRFKDDFHHIDGILLFKWYKEYLEIKLDEKEKQLYEKKLDEPLEPLTEVAPKYIGKIKDEIADKKVVTFISQKEREKQAFEAHIALARSYREDYTEKQLEDIAKECRERGYIGDAVYFETELAQ